MRRFLIRTALLCIPILMVVAGFNYFVDPMNMFSAGKIDRQIGDYLLSGYNVTIDPSYDNRMVQRYIIEHHPSLPKVAVLGSSRAMQVSHSMCGDSAIYNYGVNSASFEDFLAIYDLIETRGVRLDRVMIEISPYMFDDDPDSRSQVLDVNYNRMAYKLGVDLQGSNKIDPRLANLFSFSYFKYAFEPLLRKRAKFNPTPTIDSVSDQTIRICSDGSTRYGRLFNAHQMDVTDIKHTLVNMKPEYVDLSPQRKDVFEKFVRYLLDRSIEVQILLVPIPVQVSSVRPVVAKVEYYVRSFATAHHVTVLGTYDARRYNLTDVDFHDGFHVRQPVYDTIFSEQ